MKSLMKFEPNQLKYIHIHIYTQKKLLKNVPSVSLSEKDLLNYIPINFKFSTKNPYFYFENQNVQYFYRTLQCLSFFVVFILF